MERNSRKSSVSYQQSAPGFRRYMGGEQILLMLAAYCLLFTVFTGCSKEKTSAPPPPKKTVKPALAPVTTIVKEHYVYDPMGKKDPFRAFIDISKQGGPSKVPMTPLQAYDINELRLVGILLLPGKRVAMIEDPTGKGYNVGVGIAIGKNDGRVVEILKEEVVVEEKFIDEIGLPKTRRVSISMPKEKEGEGK